MGIDENKTKIPAVKVTPGANQLISFFNKEEIVRSNTPETAKTITGSKAHHTISGVGTELEATNIFSVPLLLVVYLF